MAHYRFYGIEPEHHRVNGRDFHCDNDEKALLLGQAMLGDFKAYEIWQSQRYVGLAVPIGYNDAADGRTAVASSSPSLRDDIGAERALAERNIRDAIAYYQNRRGWLMRHERLKLHILQRDLSRLSETVRGSATPSPTSGPGETVHFLWAWQPGDLK